MSEFESKGREHAATGASYVPGRGPTSFVTAAAKAGETITGFQRDVEAVGLAVEAVRRAHGANDRTSWQDAKAALETRLRSATRSRDAAQDHVRDASPEGQAALRAAEARLASLEEALVELAEAPRGWTALSREAELLAIVTAPNEGSAKEAWDRKEAAINAEIDQLSANEIRALSQRLRRKDPNDPIAAALAPGVRMTQTRFDGLVHYLEGARRRAAMRAPVAPRKRHRRLRPRRRPRSRTDTRPRRARRQRS